ncbi:MAG: hypothetical protein KBC43_13465 [Bacteroidales bacterium]|nr:hypothetical protein [Bacteroidales bacterium]
MNNFLAKQPLCYDPDRMKFIYYDELVSGQEEIIFPDSLSREDQKKLITERLKKGPDDTVQSISGMPYTRDDLIHAIENDEDMGNMTMEAELIMLRDLLRLIAGQRAK